MPERTEGWFRANSRPQGGGHALARLDRSYTVPDMKPDRRTGRRERSRASKDASGEPAITKQERAYRAIRSEF